MKPTDFSKLIQSIKQAGDIKKGKGEPGRVFRYGDSALDIKGVRKKLHVSQGEFALMIGVSRSTIQNWEQGRREPDGPAKALLRVAEKNPEAVIKALYAA
jgi:putative transcriptional regulator